MTSSPSDGLSSYYTIWLVERVPRRGAELHLFVFATLSNKIGTDCRSTPLSSRTLPTLSVRERSHAVELETTSYPDQTMSSCSAGWYQRTEAMHQRGSSTTISGCTARVGKGGRIMYTIFEVELKMRGRNGPCTKNKKRRPLEAWNLEESTLVEQNNNGHVVTSGERMTEMHI
jgi:hypothetical protein